MRGLTAAGARVRVVAPAQGTSSASRPVRVGAAGGHNATGGDERGPVENEDYAAVIARLEHGALAVFESSRIAIGPRAEYVIDVYGTEGSVRWDDPTIGIEWPALAGGFQLSDKDQKAPTLAMAEVFASAEGVA